MQLNAGLISLFVLIFVHLIANQVTVLTWVWHGRFLSFSAGLSLAYVFVDLLPTLEKGQPILKETFETMLPYLDRHTYLIALIGVLFYYGLHSSAPKEKKINFWLTIAGYLLFNFFTGTSLSDSNNPDIQPIVFFTIALALHLFVHDHNVGMEDLAYFKHEVRWWLIAALLIGYVLGYITQIPTAVVVVVVSFLAGGILLNSLRYELPKRNHVEYGFFVLGALIYTAILLNVRPS